MTKDELELEVIENRRFYLNMIDRWTNEDYKLDDELFNKSQKLRKRIEKTSHKPPRQS